MGVLVTASISISRELYNLAQCGGTIFTKHSYVISDARVHMCALIKPPKQYRLPAFELRGGQFRWKRKPNNLNSCFF